MILECEKCATRYLVDTADIGVLGRVVRCAECGHDWFAATDGVKPSPQAEPAPTAMPQPSKAADHEMAGSGGETAPPPGSTNLPAIVPETDDRTALMVLTIGAMALALLVLYLVFGRGQIMAVWPPAQHAFAVLGLEEPDAPPAAPEDVTPAQFVLQDMGIERVGTTITLTGTIRNEGGVPGALPALNIAEYDGAGNVVTVTFTQLESAVAELAPGDSFSLNLVHGLANAAVTRVRVSIATGEEIAP